MEPAGIYEKDEGESKYLREGVEKGNIGMATAFFERVNSNITFSELYNPKSLNVTP